MRVQAYNIEDRWLAMPYPVKIRIQALSKEIDRLQTQQTIVQIVRPPRNLEHQTGNMLQEAWHNNVYFPSIWHARPGNYRQPHVVVVAPHYVIALAVVSQTQHITLCSHIALIELEDDTIKFCPITSPHYTDAKRVLGVFKRCD